MGALLSKLLPGKMIEPGNIDLNNRPVVPNGEGYSTVRSKSFNMDGKEVLLPTVSAEQGLMTDEQAIQRYKDTGEHLGKFSSARAATKYALALHEAQAKQYGRQKMFGD